jgi:serine protease
MIQQSTSSLLRCTGLAMFILTLILLASPLSFAESTTPLPSSASSTAKDVEAASKSLATAVTTRGVGAAPQVHVRLDRSVQFQTAQGEPIILEEGNFLLEVSDAAPLKVQAEIGNSSWELMAMTGTHKQKLGEAAAQSISGPKEDEHHMVLLLPTGKTVDAVGSYSGVGTRAASPLTPALIEQASVTVPQVATLTIQSTASVAPGSLGGVSVSQLKGRALPPRPAKAMFYDGLFRDRVIVKFKEGAPVRLGPLAAGSAKPSLSLATPLMDADARVRMQRLNLTEAAVQSDLGKVNEIFKRSVVKGVASLFSRPESFLRSQRLEAESRTGQEHADLGNYFTVSLEPGTKGEELVDELNAAPSVEIAYLAPIPVDAQADIPPTTPNLQGNQGYLNPAPQGIDAQFAWTFPGGRGNGMRVIDIEQSWNTAHEDLRQPFYSNGTFGADTNHGTAVLGEMVGNNTGYGVTGIASDAAYGVVTAIRTISLPFIGTISYYSVADAVDLAASRLSRGDAILIEQHAKGPASGLQCACNCGQFEFVAMEYWQAEFDAIQAATSRGIHVVEAAGNGGMDLDAARYNNRFNRSTRDSGAIIVGASDGNRSPTCWTNRGSRVDVHGWGQGVWSTGYGTPNPQNRINGADSNQWYTNSFSGTSSASPIVTGAVMSLMGVRRAAGIEGMDPIQLRTLLRNTGTPQQNVASGQIGPLPNLRNAIGQLPLEDCVGLNPNNVQVIPIPSGLQIRWKVVDGGNWLLDYANDQSAAQRAANTIRHYGINRECFIGRPGPSMTYWLVGNQAPSGTFAGEDCIAITPSALQVQNIGGRWKIVQGSIWVEDFENKEHEARAALNIIQRYGFTSQCFVKRPNAAMQYWRQ